MHANQPSTTTPGEVMPPRKVIRIPANIDELLDRDQTLTDIAYMLLPTEVSRRGILEWISDRVDHFDGHILYADGSRFRTYPGEIDDAFGDEPSMRWISDLYRFLYERPKQKPQGKVRRRLLFLIIGFINEHCFIGVRIKGGPVRDWPGFGFETVETNNTIEAHAIPRPADWAWQAVPCLRACPFLEMNKSLAEVTGAKPYKPPIKVYG